PTRGLVCPDGPEAVYPHSLIFDSLYHPEPRGLSDQALGAGGVSGPRRDGRRLPHLGLQQTQWGRDPHLRRVGALEGGTIPATHHPTRRGARPVVARISGENAGWQWS